MALGKLTFLCLNAVCIGTLGLLVLAVLMRNYGRRTPGVRPSRKARRAADERSHSGPRLRTVDADHYYIDGESRLTRSPGSAEGDVSYEYESRPR